MTLTFAHLLLHQVLFEVLEVLRHLDVLLLATHKGLQTLGNLDVGTQNLVNLLLELSGMGRLAEDTDFARTQTVLQSLIAAGSVGVEHVARLLIAAAHGVGNLLVAIGGTADETADALVRLAIEVVDACEVRRVTHIHRVSQRLNGRTRIVLASLQVLVEYVVGIVGSDETADGQSHLVTEQSSTNVAEVATGNAHDDVVSQAKSLNAGDGIEIVECLGQEAGHVDGVG